MKKMTRQHKELLGDRMFKTKEWEVLKDTEHFLCVRNKKTGEVIRRRKGEEK